MEKIHGGNDLKKVVAIQEEFAEAGGCNLSLEKWAKVLVIKLLEATHGQ